MGQDTLVDRFSAISAKEDNFCNCLLYWMLSPFWKGVYSRGSKFFPVRADPFSEEMQKNI